MRNLAGKARRIRVDLSGIGGGKRKFRLVGKEGGDVVTLAAGEEVRWVPVG